MGQTLTHGVYLPDEGERNCYNGLAANWSILDGAVGTIAEHTAALAGKAPAVHTHTKADITDFPAYGTTAGTICEGNDSRLSDARTPVAHTHLTADVTDLLNSAHTWTGNQTYSGLTKTSGKQEQTAAVNDDLDDYILNMETYNWGTSHINTPESFGSLLVLNREGNTHSSSYTGWLNQIGFGTTGKLYHRYKVNVAGSWSVWRKIYTNWDNYIPGQNNTYDLGSSSYQWNNLYAKGYYYNGVAWGLDKANEWSSEQTCKSKNPKWINQNTNITMGVAPASNQTCAFFNYDKNGNEIGRLISRVQTDGKTVTWVSATNLYKNGAIDPTGSSIWANLYCAVDANGYPHVSTDCDLTPNVNNSYNLGTSTNKWKTLNGINPGALSLPDIGAYTDLTSNIPSASLNGSTEINLSSYITTKGWLAIVVPDTNTDDFVFCQNGSTLSNRYFMSGARGNGFISLMMPINNAGEVKVQIKASSVSFCRFYPCLGNV